MLCVFVFVQDYTKCVHPIYLEPGRRLGNDRMENLEFWLKPYYPGNNVWPCPRYSMHTSTAAVLYATVLFYHALQLYYS